MSMGLTLGELARCFVGVIPSTLATCDAAGTPNVTFVSQIHYIDPRHVAVSCQFFNKTRRNLGENPHATALCYDPLTFQAFRLRLRYDHSETEGPLYELMSLRIEAIATHTGMAGIFRLLSADVFEVLAVERVDGYLEPGAGVRLAPLPTDGPLTELRCLQLISCRVTRCADLDQLLDTALAALEELLDFHHSMVLMLDETGRRLSATASRGYGAHGIGAEVEVGVGLIGQVAASRRALRIAGVPGELRYGRTIRDRALQADEAPTIRPEIPLPGLPDAQSQLALPLVVQERLLGVLAFESRDPLRFRDWHETYLQILANQIAMAIDHMSEADDEVEPAAATTPSQPITSARPRAFLYYRNDDCIFVDGEYLIRNVPAKILWKLLRGASQGRTEFCNRELRLDPTLGLPPVKDNLESRLILLRRRLEQKCPEVRIVPVRRGIFQVQLDCPIVLQDRETA